MRSAATLLAAIAALLFAPEALAQKAPSVLKPKPDMFAYTMQKGDNLYTLAGRYFLHLSDYRAVQGLNRIANPRRIPVGKVIGIPVRLLRVELLSARLVAARGDVRAWNGARILPVSTGMALPIGTAVETGANGFLTIELPNGSRTTLPTRSRIVIRQLRRFLLGGAIDYDLEVGAGKAETEATPLGPGKGDLRVRTPRAVSAVRGTRFRVGYDGEQTSAEVLEGVVGVGAGNDPSEAVEAGFGARIASNGQIREEALLPPVDLVDPGKVQIDDEVDLQLNAVAEASAYHVQIGKDAGFVDVVADLLVVQPDARFANIANGNWFVRATAISQSGLEGLYQTYSMKRRLTGLSASAEGSSDTLRFRWNGAGEGWRVYRFQMMRADPATLPIVDEGGLGNEGLELHHFEPGIYYWRVGVRQFAMEGSQVEMTEKWLPFEKLIVAPQGK
ncbi:FecR domain-containing protein [Sphingobium nicotianae]|uniref:FecR domain-containing protein n=1 Tax=Sphingobium nicotianae TaxID=2782607 RepID=A0A9X1IT64_9SPHN|nr:FecR domain-containing protein [Sphingobium nicotianae]MBT2188997.1 FecR domain-containing protein [Sphingobium nicotianae]